MIAVPAAGLGLVPGVSAAAVPATLAESTVHVGLLTTGGVAGATSGAVLTLTEGVMKGLLLAKLKGAKITCTTVCITTHGVAEERKMNDVARATNGRRASRKLDMAAQRAATRELAAIERRLAKLPLEIAEVNVRIAEHDQRDYLGVAAHMETLANLEAKLSDLETRWLELTEQLEAGTGAASPSGSSLRGNIKNP